MAAPLFSESVLGLLSFFLFSVSYDEYPFPESQRILHLPFLLQESSLLFLILLFPDLHHRIYTAGNILLLIHMEYSILTKQKDWQRPWKPHSQSFPCIFSVLQNLLHGRAGLQFPPAQVRQ